MKKRFTNMEDVDRQLQILKLEREIQLRKMGMRLEDTTQLFAPNSLMKSGFSTLTSTLKGTSSVKSILLTIMVRFLMKKIFKR